MSLNTYTVRARRWDHGWELHISGPDDYQGTTQSRGLMSAERMARDYIALDLEVAPDTFTVDIVPEVGGPLGDLVKDAKTAIHYADEAIRAAAEKSRRAVADMHRAGMTQTEIARVLRVSQQRVSQLLNEGRKSARSRTREKV
jgi:DNA-directed RNA polymerase specialized sigma24 family protein